MRNCYFGFTPLTLPYMKMGFPKLLLILLISEGRCTQSRALKETLLLAHHQKPLSDPTPQNRKHSGFQGMDNFNLNI